MSGGCSHKGGGGGGRVKNPCLQPKLWEQPDQFSHVRYKESYSHRLRAENQIQEKAASGPSARRESEVHGLPSYTVTLPVDGHTKASFEARRVTLRFLSSVAFQAGVSEKVLSQRQNFAICLQAAGKQDVSVVRVTAKPTDPRSLPAVEVTTKIVWDLSMLPRNARQIVGRGRERTRASPAYVEHGADALQANCAALLSCRCFSHSSALLPGLSPRGTRENPVPPRLSPLSSLALQS
eukprot:2193797-Rhodomonas_salina.1